ncbi:MAG TPA: hypothetical protein VFD70_16795 [Anaerolineae bacterium]|nr:hypothetical protein [Anaerolineae bacterium]
MKFVKALWVLALGASLVILVGSLPAYWALANGRPNPVPFNPEPQSTAWLNALVSVSCAALCVALAVLLFVKKSNDRMALFLSFYLMLYGIILAGPLETFLPFWFPASGALALQVQGALVLMALPLTLVFPNGCFMPRWTRWLVVIGILEIPIALLTIGNLDELYRVNSLTAQALYIVLGVLLVLALGVQVYRYRRVYTPLERQQTKWVLYGFLMSYVVLALVSIPYMYMTSLPPNAPVPGWVGLTSVGWSVALTIQPIAITIAILRARLWDIDVIIRRTVSYGILVAVLVVVYFGSVIVLQQLFATISGQRSEVITVLSTLAIAALFVPLRNRIQNIIDKRFYRKKYDSQKVLNRFSVTVRDETDLEKLTGSLVEVVNETMQPKSVSVWLKQADERATR